MFGGVSGTGLHGTDEVTPNAAERHMGARWSLLTRTSSSESHSSLSLSMASTWATLSFADWSPPCSELIACEDFTLVTACCAETWRLFTRERTPPKLREITDELLSRVAPLLALLLAWSQFPSKAPSPTEGGGGSFNSSFGGGRRWPHMLHEVNEPSWCS